jgi:hypothetical protein
LRFDSFQAASAATDLLFRAPVKIPASASPTDDDVSEVEQRKRLHVKSLIEALKHDGPRSALLVLDGSFALCSAWLGGNGTKESSLSFYLSFSFFAFAF